MEVSQKNDTKGEIRKQRQRESGKGRGTQKNGTVMEGGCCAKVKRGFDEDARELVVCLLLLVP